MVKTVWAFDHVILLHLFGYLIYFCYWSHLESELDNTSEMQGFLLVFPSPSLRERGKKRFRNKQNYCAPLPLVPVHPRGVNFVLCTRQVPCLYIDTRTHLWPCQGRPGRDCEELQFIAVHLCVPWAWHCLLASQRGKSPRQLLVQIGIVLLLYCFHRWRTICIKAAVFCCSVFKYKDHRG